MRLINYYPPFYWSGIRVFKEKDGSIRSELRLRWWNRNLFGTHYGGSLYSMCDPFFVFILIEKLGKEFIIWDKAASIRFKKPGKGTVVAKFEISDAQVTEIEREVKAAGKKDYTFTTNVLNDSGEVVAEVEKLIYVRHKQNAKAPRNTNNGLKQ